MQNREGSEINGHRLDLQNVFSRPCNINIVKLFRHEKVLQITDTQVTVGRNCQPILK